MTTNTQRTWPWRFRSAQDSDPALAWKSQNDENGKRGTILGGVEQKAERLGVARSTRLLLVAHPSLPHTLSLQQPLASDFGGQRNGLELKGETIVTGLGRGRPRDGVRRITQGE